MTQEADPSSEPHPIWYLVVVVAAGLSSVAIALFVKGGVGDVQGLQERKQQLIELKKERKKRLRKLRQREKRLHRDPYLIEKLAREKLGLRRPGEKRIRIEEGPDTTIRLEPPATGTDQFGSLSFEPDE